MDLLGNLALGLSVAVEPWNLFYCFIGALLGTLIGVLPGIGPAATIAMLLPVTFSLDPSSSLIMLAGIYYGAQYGGSTTAILINLPGESSATVTAIDGYQMARKGRAGAALAIAAIGSFIAGSLTTFVVAAFAAPLTNVALRFGAADYFSLIVVGLFAAVALARGSVLKALAMMAFGVLLGLIGSDIETGAARFTFNLLPLYDGLDFVAMAVGLFGISEILRNLEHKETRSVLVGHVSGLMPTREDMRRSIGPILRGAGIGSLLGVLPGGGALLSSFASYAIERKLSKSPEEFGHGAIEGVAGPESANNAGAQASFIPMLTLGIPSNALMALMIGAMIIQGIVPGPSVIVRQPELFWGVIASMWIGNLMLIVLNLPLIGIWVRLLQVPYHVLFPAIMAFSAIGVFSFQLSPFSLYTMAFFGALGYLLSKLDCEPAPLLLGFILGPLLEQYFRRAMKFSHGDPLVFVTEPISASLLALGVAMLIITVFPAIRRKREEVFVED